MFGIIVVFQAEIRKGLAHLGQTPFLGGAARRRQEEIVDEIVLAATGLAAERTGAIMVLEREMGLRSYIETGIALDAVVTYDLLVSIFNPATPLHDGAVVIQGNRVAAAACFLPLTVNPRAHPHARQPAPRRDRPHRGHRCGGDRRLGGDGHDLASSRAGASARGLDGPTLGRTLLGLLGLGEAAPARAKPAEVRREGEA